MLAQAVALAMQPHVFAPLPLRLFPLLPQEWEFSKIEKILAGNPMTVDQV